MKWVAWLVVLAGVARAEPVVLKFSTVAPEGSPWARELVAFARQVDSATEGQVKIKWYMNAVAGDELEQLERLRRGQLDGAASGQMMCERLAPSMRISHVPALFQSRDEATVVMNRLQPNIEEEGLKSGAVMLATTGLGPSVFFLRSPAHTLGEMRRTRFWRWDLDEMGILAARAMGFQLVTLPVHQAAHAYDQKQLDGFVGIPAAALAFQWSAQARYLIDLRIDYLWGCVVVSQRAFARLPPPAQAAVREAAARVRERFEDVGRRIDDQLLGGLFQKQGLVSIPVTESLRAEFFDAARTAREQVAEKFVPRELLNRVLQILADYRAEHPGRR